MKIMYIFPHPDDESFGPAGAISKQIEEGHEVILLTLTQGGATKVRHQLGLSIQQMGDVRVQEMQAVKTSLGLSEMTILDYADGELSKVNPLALEQELTKWIAHYQPTVVVTYPVHGGSGHHDHIALHHSIKRLFYTKPEVLSTWKRLAYFTVKDTDKPMFLEGGIPRVTWTKEKDISVAVTLEKRHIEAMKNALLCYKTYQEMVQTTNVIERIGSTTYFELEDEKHNTMLNSITAVLAKEDDACCDIKSTNCCDTEKPLITESESCCATTCCS